MKIEAAIGEAFGVEILLRDGRSEWIDPVTEDPTEVNGILSISNTCSAYSYKAKDIASWFKYAICEQCGFDHRTYDCESGGCQNPRNALEDA